MSVRCPYVSKCGRVQGNSAKKGGDEGTASILATCAALTYVVSETTGAGWVRWVSFVPAMVGFVGMPVAVGIAVLRYHLYNVDLLINRTLVYGTLTVTLALVYFGGVATTEAILRALTSQEQQPQLAVVASTLERLS